MSAAVKDEEEKLCCALCGIAGVDDIKLKECDDCDLVRYCSDECQKDHRPQHKQECKKRVAELKDEILFKQPERSYLGDCPICSLPLPIDPEKSGLYSCCSKQICVGCCYANQKREAEGRLEQKCPFCRKPLVSTDEEYERQLMKRVEANDPAAISHMGSNRYREEDYTAAFQYLTNAADLGQAEAHYRLSMMYRDGKGVEKDEKRALHHAEKAAIGGDPGARHHLGYIEAENGRMDRAVKHLIIAAKQGNDDSLESIKNLYKTEHVSKGVFATALRGHHAAIAATKSPQREEAYEYAKWVAERRRGI